MRAVQRVLPIIIITLTLGLSYYLFSNYQPKVNSQVKDDGAEIEKRGYLDSLPLPSGSKEIGRNVREGFSQITLSSPKPSQEIQTFFRTVLNEKGWKNREADSNVLSSVYTRDEERIEVSVLSFDETRDTVFSVSYSD